MFFLSVLAPSLPSFFSFNALTGKLMNVCVHACMCACLILFFLSVLAPLFLLFSPLAIASYFPPSQSLLLLPFDVACQVLTHVIFMQNVKLVAPHRRYVREAPATRWDRQKKVEKPIHLFLFNDILIWTKTSPPGPQKAYEVTKIDSLITLMVKNCERMFLSLYLSPPGFLYTL